MAASPAKRWRDGGVRDFLQELPAELERYGPFEFVFPAEPEPWRRALLKTLGVAVVVEPGAELEVRRVGSRGTGRFPLDDRLVAGGRSVPPG